MLITKETKKYYVEDELNCAQAIFLGASEVYKLGYTVETSRFIKGFGGGMGCGEACGAVTGGVAILSELMLKNGDVCSMDLKEATAHFIAKFSEVTGTIKCADLVATYRESRPRGCWRTVEIACEALEQVLAEALGEVE